VKAPANAPVVAPAAAAPVTKSAAGVAITTQSATSIATHFLENKIDSENWIPNGLKRSPAIPVDAQFVGDRSAPVTGKGHIVSLIVKQKPGTAASFGQRLAYRFPLKLGNRYRARQFDVFVDEDGNATELGTQQSLDPMSKLKDFVKPFAMYKQGDVTKGLATIGTHAAAITAATIVPALIPVEVAAGIVNVAYAHKTAVNLALAVNEKAVNETATWAKGEVTAFKNGEVDHAPNLSDAYNYYLAKVNAAGTPAAPVTAVKFAQLLAAQGM
jgi:hypothetical protein